MKIINCLKKNRESFFAIDSVSCNKHIQNNRQPFFLFLLVVLFYVVYQLCTQPNWVLGGEMWAEMASNYYHNASSASYFQKFFSTDSGYIPAPQRLIAFVGNQLNFKAASIPYFYTWISILLTGMMIGVFCLPQFRKLIKSDFLRFLTALSILMVTDFETKTFISFTYFSAYYIAIITALALVDDSEELAWWAWFIPIFMVSKPAVIAALPAMILVAMVSKSRFRIITIVAVVLCLGQVLQLFISSMAGVMAYRNDKITILSKLIASFKYFFCFLGGYITGPNFNHFTNKSFLFGNDFMILIGILIFGFCVYLIFFKKNKTNALIIVGLSLLFFNMFLNTFCLSDIWNGEMARVSDLPIYRHMIVGFFGCILTVCGILSVLTNNVFIVLSKRYRWLIGAVLFLVWFLGVGWFSRAVIVSREPNYPTINSSQWQNMTIAIDSGTTPLCVPIDPWFKDSKWMYQRNCGLFQPAPAWENGFVLTNKQLYFDLKPSKVLYDKTLVATAIMVMPLSTGDSFVEAQMRIKLKDGNIKYFTGSRKLNSFGGLLLLTGADSIAIKNISSIRLLFNLPVKIATTAGDPVGVPGIAWMGH